jgi:Mrp family chromosome partitioning ATPase
LPADQVDDLLCADIIIQSEYPNLEYISSGEIPPNPSELLGDKAQMEQFFSHLRSQYDIIIVDTAPLGLVSDTFQLLDYSDINLYVVRQNVTPRSLFAQIMEELEEKEISNIAIAPNDFGGVSRKSYGYRYGYYHKSKHNNRKSKK